MNAEEENLVERAKAVRKMGRLLQAGRAADALDVAAVARERWPEDLRLASLTGLALEATERRGDAIEMLEGAIATASEASAESLAEIRSRLALCYLSDRKYKQARSHAEAAIAAGSKLPFVLYIAGTASFKLGDIASAVKWGAEALEIKDREAMSRPEKSPPCSAVRPRSFNSSKPERNIISYSLFGTDPYYHDCAVTNAAIALSAYPDFTARFYCGEDVPEAVLTALRHKKADVRIMRAQTKSRWEGLFWRFWAFDDPQVDVVLVRDADSPLSPRERIAVEDWLYNSDRPFHVMRDHPGHTAPIMAGLWGGFTGLLPAMQATTCGFLLATNYRYADQDFLRNHIWPAIRHATLAHDSNFRLAETRPFPPWGRVVRDVHVGWAWPNPKKTRRSIVA